MSRPGAVRGPHGVRTTCPYCGVGCGIVAAADGRGAAAIAGDPEHPANRGRLCSKGAALGETLGLEGRLLRPRVAGRDAPWDEALRLVADRFAEAIAARGPDSVALYVSGQMLTEDYYVANKLMKGFVGSANIDTNSRLCMASTVAGHRRAFGTDTVPGLYEDFEQADLVVLVGSNLAWCHPVLHQRLAAAREALPGLRVVVIDPRRTATAETADLHLPIRPGADVALFNGLLAHLRVSGAVDTAWVDRHVSGLPEALAAAGEARPEMIGRATGLRPSDVHRFLDLWTRTERVVTAFSQGVNQSSRGTDKVNAILNCHLATGRIGRPGMGPFSLTGQPNAMGGREVGGLANALACHLDIENPVHRAAVRDFWRAPRMVGRPGLKAVDLFRACRDGRIAALWIIGTNPAVSMPEADAVRAAIAAVPFVVVSDIVARTDTTSLADVVLPAAGWGEKSGTVTNSERCIARQRAFLPLPGEVRPDWKILAGVAARMGWSEAFAWTGPAAIFREYATLSGVAARLGSDFDISGLAGLSDEDYARMRPVRWPVPAAGACGGRFFADGGFFTPDGRARMIAVRPSPPVCAASRAFPLRLNTGRVRDHWHTMTRTAKSPRLSAHLAEPFAEIHPVDAGRAGIGAGALVAVQTDRGRIVVRAHVTTRVAQGSIFVPMHWTSEWSSAGRVNAAVAAEVDRHSGQPELKASVARIEPFRAAWHAFAASAGPIRLTADYWALARSRAGWRGELAGSGEVRDWEEEARAIFGLPDAPMVTFTDRARGVARFAFLEEGRVTAAIFVSPGPVRVAREHLLSAIDEAVGADLLAGRPGADRRDPGATVCACFDVGENTILAAIAERNLADVEAVGRALRAGTGCGSCLPEIRALLGAAAIPAGGGRMSLGPLRVPSSAVPAARGVGPSGRRSPGPCSPDQKRYACSRVAMPGSSQTTPTPAACSAMKGATPV